MVFSGRRKGKCIVCVSPQSVSWAAARVCERAQLSPAVLELFSLRRTCLLCQCSILRDSCCLCEGPQSTFLSCPSILEPLILGTTCRYTGDQERLENASLCVKQRITVNEAGLESLSCLKTTCSSSRKDTVLGQRQSPRQMVGKEKCVLLPP